MTISLVGTAIALSAFCYQAWRPRFNQSVDLLFKLEADFFGPAKRLQRAKAAAGILRGRFEEVEPIPDFFETMGLLVRRGAPRQRMVWHTFFYWTDNYFTLADRTSKAAKTETRWSGKTSRPSLPLCAEYRGKS